MSTAAERIAAAATTGLTAPADASVGEAMVADVVAVAPGASLTEIARTMVQERIHGVVVGDPVRGPWGFVSDLDLVRIRAGEAPQLPRAAVTVPASATLVAAGRLMGRHEV